MPLTKEDILDSFMYQISTRKENYEAILKAMDEYTKQQAIEFMKFVDAFYSQQVSSQAYDEMYSQFIDNQFIEQQNKQA